MSLPDPLDPPSKPPPSAGSDDPTAQRPRRRFRLRRMRPLGGLGKWRGRRGFDDRFPGDGYGRKDFGDDDFGVAFDRDSGELPFGDPFADDEPRVPAASRRRSRGFYLLPNAFTTGCLFSGFYAVVMAMNDQFAAAAVAVFIAMLLDSLDGRVARLTNTQSPFGEQYDSLADMVSFGAAPALIVYSWALKGMGKMGWVAAFIYVAGAALRLARFNTNIGVVDKRFFQGLPSPAAAALVVGLVWVATDLRELRWITASGPELAWLAWIVTVYAGITMVASVPFYSFKDLNFRRAVPFMFVLLLVAGFVLVSSDPPTVLFLLFVVYGLSGYVLWGWRRWRGKPAPAAKPGPAVPAPASGSMATRSAPGPGAETGPDAGTSGAAASSSIAGSPDSTVAARRDSDPAAGEGSPVPAGVPDHGSDSAGSDPATGRTPAG
jgi:CDP-diacylglycerol--serine O-phosphatidyltransferase